MKINIIKSAQKELDKIPDEIALRISNKIFEVGDNPYMHGSEKLEGGKGYRVRIGYYRVIYTIDKENKIVSVTKVRNRKEAYR